MVGDWYLQKKYYFVTSKTLLCLSKYLFEIKYNDFLEKDSKNKYEIENKDLEISVWKIHGIHY